jgi:hypothetical protein
MTKRTLSLWMVEFACVTAIGIIPSTTLALWWILAPAFLILIIKAVETRSFASEKNAEVRRQLQLLLTVLPADGAQIRCTCHMPVKTIVRRRVRLLQVFDYVGDQGGGGRTFDPVKGIIGVTYSAKGTCVENFRDDAEYRERMVAQYRYTRDEVGLRRADRRSYLCDPLFDENHNVLGLLYFDSDHYGLFTLEEDNPRWRMIRAANGVIRGSLLG